LKNDIPFKSPFEILSTVLPSSNGSLKKCPLYTPPFQRINFDDMKEAAIEERKPAWKQLEESIKDSYYKVRKTAERSKEEMQFMDSQLCRRNFRRSESPFEILSARSPSVQSPSFHTSHPLTTGEFVENNIYVAPAVFSTQGIESRHEKKANDIEARLLRTSVLPQSMKTITTKEFRNGPAPAAGSTSEILMDEVDYQAFLPRPYYSRPNRHDPDYFDFDLQHSVDLYRRPEGKYVPRGPQEWEEKILQEMKSKGEAPVSGYMFTKGNTDWRNHGTSYLSAALRTASFWEQRFTAIGREIRDKNPISFESLARNKPVTSRWTEYRDPDFEDLTDLDD
uniref:INCENP_ARK-bind domain-containing protein n=1 Tax=Dracunculus medinensis TaxID=318479 RepID=A0A0N4U896_DRAME